VKVRVLLSICDLIFVLNSVIVHHEHDSIHLYYNLTQLNLFFFMHQIFTTESYEKTFRSYRSACLCQSKKHIFWGFTCGVVECTSSGATLTNYL